jgi:hypothetical protein
MVKRIFNRISTILSQVPIPLILLGVCVLTYGLLIPWLGFFLDDWYIILFQKHFGAGDFSLFFKQDRPLFAYVYNIFVPIFRDSKIGWQIFTLFTHALAASCFWWLLIRVMPSRKKLAVIAALLFSVYPGFQVHWFSVMYGQVFMLYAIYFLSFILMIDAIEKKKGRIIYWVGSIICLVIGVVPQETFIGLEMMRPIILWIIFIPIYPSRKLRIKQVLQKWVPYLLTIIAFVIYRLGNSDSFSYKATLFTELQRQPLQTIIRLLGEIFWSTVDATLRAWVKLIEILDRNMLSLSSIAMLLLITFGIVFVYLLLRHKSDDEPNNQNRWIIWISLLATVSAMAPFIVGSFQVKLEFPNNRYLIALAPGASLFLAGLIDTLLHTSKQKILIISILVGFAMGSQFMTARSLMLSWEAQKEFFWELTWRAPEIKPDTILVTEDVYFSNYLSSTSLTAPLNLIYANENTSHQIPYLFVLESQQEGVISSYEPNTPIKYSFRSFEFNGNTSSMLLFTKLPNSCLRIITPDNSPAEFLYSNRYTFWHNAIPLSNPERITADPEVSTIPPKEYFGSEDRNQWCYFYEKAELARQQKQWSQTIKLYQEAKSVGFEPGVDSEWLPLVDAYLNINEIYKAVEITNKITNHEKPNTAGFCQLWVKAKESDTATPAAEEMISWLNCEG